MNEVINSKKLEIACDHIRHGAEYLCTHPDFNCPTETGFIPDSGAIAALVTASTGVEPVYLGKLYATTIDMISEVTGVAREDVLKACEADRPDYGYDDLGAVMRAAQ